MKRHRFRHQVSDRGLEVSGRVVKVRLVVHLPVATDRHPAVVHGEDVPRQEFLDALEHGLAAEAELEAEIVFEALEIGLDRGQKWDERLDLAREIEDSVDLGVVEGFDPEAIAGAEKRLRLFVPDREGEHAAEVVDAVRTPLLVGAERDLGVRGRAEPPAAQLGAQLDVVVDLAVV